MKKVVLSISVLLFIFVTGIAFADRGQVWPYPVTISEESQKAIILHNRDEEVLILGTELKANREVNILEFIPFPAEPKVSLAEGNPFETIKALLAQKKIGFLRITKGGSTTTPVELKFSEKIGVHDVTVIKINDIEGFSKWVREFFKKKRIPVKNNLSTVYKNAEDYVKRGYNYFVFDYVPVKKEAKFGQPLVYKFHSTALYYPLKDSNIIGGEGKIELMLALPGSLGLLKDRSDLKKVWELFNSSGGLDISSSSKAYPEEIAKIYPEAGEFFKNGKIYMQMVRFSGRYNFKDDLVLDISNIGPYAYKHIGYRPNYQNYSAGGNYRLLEPLSEDEKKDIAEAYAQKRPEWYFDSVILREVQGSN